VEKVRMLCGRGGAPIWTRYARCVFTGFCFSTLIIDTDLEDKDVRCPYWGRKGYCETEVDVDMKCQYSCEKYRDVSPASKPYPYPIEALHPYQPNPIPWPIPTVRMIIYTL